VNPNNVFVSNARGSHPVVKLGDLGNCATFSLVVTDNKVEWNRELTLWQWWLSAKRANDSWAFMSELLRSGVELDCFLAQMCGAWVLRFVLFQLS